MSNIFNSGIIIKAASDTTGESYINFQLESGQTDWFIKNSGDNDIESYRALVIGGTSPYAPSITLDTDGAIWFEGALVSQDPNFYFYNQNGSISLQSSESSIIFDAKFIQTSNGAYVNSIVPTGNYQLTKFIGGGATGFLPTGFQVITINTDLVTGQVTGVMRPFLPRGIEYKITNEGTGFDLSIINNTISGAEIIKLRNSEGCYKAATIVKIGANTWSVMGSHLLGDFIMS